MLWQLKKLSTNESLTNPAPLPENWGPIFGLSGIQERLSDLSWLGDAYVDLGWIQVEGRIEDLAQGQNLEQIQSEKVNNMLSDVSTRIASATTVEEKANLLNYQAALTKVPHQKGYPANIVWPPKPF